MCLFFLYTLQMQVLMYVPWDMLTNCVAVIALNLVTNHTRTALEEADWCLPVLVTIGQHCFNSTEPTPMQWGSFVLPSCFLGGGLQDAEVMD